MLAVAILAAVPTSCGRPGPPQPAIDLVAALKQADRRPAPEAFTVADVTVGGVTMRGIETAASSRATWELTIPAHAVLRTSLAVRSEGCDRPAVVLFRIGVADARTYDELLSRHVQGPDDLNPQVWTRVAVDLSLYGGFKWSLFYQPGRRSWKLAFNTSPEPPHAADGCGIVPVWGGPIIYAPRTS